jgi:ankyrin repeat protein
MSQVLLGQGASINARDKKGWMPLHCAAQAGFLDIVHLLVENGASTTAETNEGHIPLW